jgi:Histidine kinase/Y_Y_Y domain
MLQKRRLGLLCIKWDWAALLLCLLASTTMVWAQQPAYFLMGEEQFEGVQIYGMIQDLESNYWFATDEGIYKHDGYTYARVDCPGMIGSSVFGLTINSQGTIFCFNLNHQIIKIEDGVVEVIYELQADERTSDIHLAVTPEDQLVVVAQRTLLMDADGHVAKRSPIWPNYFGAPFLTQQGTVVCHLSTRDSLLEISEHGFKVVVMPHAGEKMAGVLRFFRMRGRSFAINVGSKAIYAFDEANYSLALIGVKPFLPVEEFLRFYNVNDQLWISSNISGVRLLRDCVRQQAADLWFPQHMISAIYKDLEGNLLLSTFNHGVVVIPDLSIPDAVPIPGGQSVMGLHHDPDLGMLLGTATGQLLVLKAGQMRLLSDAGIKPLEGIYSWPGHPLVIFDDGKLKAYDKRSGQIHAIGLGSLKGAIALDTSTLYLALNIGLSKISWDEGGSFTQQAIPQLEMRCYAVACDDDHTVYVSTADGMKVLAADGTVTDLLFNGARIFANDLTFGDGTLYIASKNHGLLILGKGMQTVHIQPQMAGERLEFSQLLLHARQLYASSSAGLIVFQLDGSGFTQLNKANGLGTNRVIDFALDDDQLWLTHSKGMQYLRLASLHQPVPMPSIVLRQVTVGDTMPQAIDTPGIFDHTQRKFLFQVSSPTLRYRENIVYHYRLLGYEDAWTTAPYRDHEFTYNALGPGEYVFQVKAENRGQVSPPVSYAFSISEPLYARWWFIGTVALLVLALITMIYLRQLIVQRRKASMLNELNLSRLTAIQSQMNPHFIFNALNSIQDLVLQGDIDNSYTFITKFANLVRRTLNYSDKDFIEFEQEMELLRLYLSLEKLRFKHDFEYTIASHEIDDIQVPPMLIQPFVENALIHGLIHREGPKRLDIRFELGETLICTIEDNGVGREKAREIKARQGAAEESFSGAAIRKRFAILSAHFEGALGFDYEDLMQDGLPAGTKVTLHIPVKRRF